MASDRRGESCRPDNRWPSAVFRSATSATARPVAVYSTICGYIAVCRARRRIGLTQWNSVPFGELICIPSNWEATPWLNSQNY